MLATSKSNLAVEKSVKYTLRLLDCDVRGDFIRLIACCLDFTDYSGRAHREFFSKF